MNERSLAECGWAEAFLVSVFWLPEGWSQRILCSSSSCFSSCSCSSCCRKKELSWHISLAPLDDMSISEQSPRSDEGKALIDLRPNWHGLLMELGNPLYLIQMDWGGVERVTKAQTHNLVTVRRDHEGWVAKTINTHIAWYLTQCISQSKNSASICGMNEWTVPHGKRCI